jgi:epoxyqueuosine reductase
MHNQGVNATSLTGLIRERALELGFALCGVAPAERFPELAEYDGWLAQGFAGDMGYLADERRRDPRLAMESARSVIVCALNYNTAFPPSMKAALESPADESRGWISRYAWGTDYHEVMWAKLNELTAAMREEIAEPFEARAYADTGPVSERVFAKHAGLGWIGKNTLLLNERMGSLFFLGVILTSLELEPTTPASGPPRDLCGSCTRCIDACPTEALIQPRVLDARRCISYLTIEKRGEIPEEFRQAMGWHVYGCDICQDVCPYNRRSEATELKEFQPRETAEGEALFLPRLAWLAGMSEEDYRQSFRGSAMKRTKWKGLVRNACNALGNTTLERGSKDYQNITALLRKLADSEDSGVASSAQWALSRIQLTSV